MKKNIYIHITLLLSILLIIYTKISDNNFKREINKTLNYRLYSEGIIKKNNIMFTIKQANMTDLESNTIYQLNNLDKNIKNIIILYIEICNNNKNELNMNQFLYKLEINDIKSGDYFEIYSNQNGLIIPEETDFTFLDSTKVLKYNEKVNGYLLYVIPSQSEIVFFTISQISEDNATENLYERIPYYIIQRKQ